MGGVIFIHYFFSLETAKHQEKWSVSLKLLRISSGNVNASGVVTFQYSQIY